MSGNTLVPNLVLAQRVLRKMAAAASEYLEDETGEAMVGIWEPGINTGGVPTIYILDTISPDETAFRDVYAFKQGDDRQDDIIWWLKMNWEAKRKKRAASFGRDMQSKWDVPLIYLGDWHKHPGYMISPSGGDLETALYWLDDHEDEMDFLLVPILTIGHDNTMHSGEGISNYISIPGTDGTSMRVDFWFIHRDARQFMPINPAVYPDDQLPTVAAYPWHILNQERIDEEMYLLTDDGLFVSPPILQDTDDKLPLEVCFLVARMGVADALIVATPRDFPKSAPYVYRAPARLLKFEDEIGDMFRLAWGQAERLQDPEGWRWTPEKRLLEYVHRVEDMLGIQRPKKMLVQSESLPPEPMPPAYTATDTPATTEAKPDDETITEDTEEENT